MPGFAKLDAPCAIQVLNMPENIAPLSEAANTWKGYRSYDDRLRQRGRGLDDDAVFRGEIGAPARALEPLIQQRIDTLLKAR